MRPQPIFPAEPREEFGLMQGHPWRLFTGLANVWTCGPLRVIASSGEGWDHVSVSTESRCPSWNEMEFVKRSFFYPEECVMQLHVPEAEHVNHMPFCLHLWRPTFMVIPRPPNRLVGAPA